MASSSQGGGGEDDDDDEGVCRMSVELRTGRDELQANKKKLRLSLASLPRAAVARAAISLKRVRVNRDSTAQLAVFMLKVGALEALRRGLQHRCPPLWWIIQAIPLFRAPPFAWLQRWYPFRCLIQGTQIFSKPVVFLSIATALTNAWDQHGRPGEGSIFPAPPPLPSPPPSPRSPSPRSLQDREDSQAMALRKLLEEHGIFVPDRISNDELHRFYQAANKSNKRFVALVKKNVGWRQNFRFLSCRELDEWSELVYWHHHDSQDRPLLIIRLGLASTTLVSSQRPRFAQAIVSQIEFGVVNLLRGEDPRITVVLDCAGAPAVGFPLQMTKSCCVLVQENYPTRLAALFIVNLPPFVRVVATAIVQILKPATRDKIYVESDDCARILAEHLGGLDWVPIYLGGNCKCSLCNEARAALDEERQDRLHELVQGVGNNRQQQQQISFGQRDYLFSDQDEEDVTPFQSCTRVLRVAIIGLLMLWIVVALVAGLYEPHLDELPT
ncbi:uncharacterized protein LOC9653159 [Selaginella moellendorffii]|nr:uncharacterized protein LOC9653159 [Selaginella moellendorffii]|eukprot:XP_002985514.2 uncharacterized protein LOC9653159 [Selaginella moellendorffii]